MSTDVGLTGVIVVSPRNELKQQDLERDILAAFRTAQVTHVNDVRERLFVFDFSRIYWCDLGALVWLISLLHSLKKRGNDLRLIFPEPSGDMGNRVWDFLIRWQFFEALSSCVDDPINVLKPEQLPRLRKKIKYSIPFETDKYTLQTILHSVRLLEITTIRAERSDHPEETVLGQFLQKYSDRVITAALGQLCGWGDANTRRFVQTVVREGVSNSLLHGEGTFANISMSVDSKYLTLVIADNGVGIPEVLRNFAKNNEQWRSLPENDAELIKLFTESDLILASRDSDLIALSVKEGTTTRPMEHKGLGLYYLKLFVLEQGGELRIRSGRACVDFQGSSTKSYDDMLEGAGTMLRIRTPVVR